MTARQQKKEEAAKRAAGEQAGKELNEALEAADPKDGEQPKPANGKDAAPAEAKDEKAEEKKPRTAKKLALSEIEGDIADGAKVRIGVQSFTATGGEVNRVLTVPKAFEIVGPASRPGNVHARDAATPERTLCTLPTNWTSGVTVYPDGTYITCEPCARRLIAVKKLDQAAHDKARTDAQEARDKRLQDEAEAKDKKAAEDKAAKEAAKQAAKEAKPAETPAETPAPVEAKADPKPTPTKRTRRSRKAATSKQS